MWREVVTEPELEEYLFLLKQSHSIYEKKSSLEGLEKIKARPGHLFIFDATRYKILLAVSVRDKGGRDYLPDQGKIVNAMPVGNYQQDDLDNIAKHLIRKVRTVFDAMGISEFQADVLSDYQSRRLNDLYQKSIPRLMHEYQPGKNRLNGAHPSRGMKFTRLPSRKKDDEKFIGPGG
jgi:hypothetical protein